MHNKRKKLILIDGNAIIHRAYHALPPLMTKKGELVNAVYGFTSTLLSVIDKFEPDYVVATFDLAGPTFRHEQFKDYKATRVKADDALYAQIPRVKEVVKAFNIPICEKQGFEADDVIGTIAKQMRSEKEPIETIIVTGDMDTLQLIDGTEKVYTMRRGISDAVTYDEEKVMERYGIRPDQLIDFKGLRGDPSDNIPGVKGIGEKTAVELLQKFDTLKSIYEHIDEIKGAVKDKLTRDKANAFLSKELATIDQNVPIEFDLEKAKLHDYDRKELVGLLTELNFFSLVKRLPGITTEKTENEPVKEVKDFKYETADEKTAKEKIKELGDAKEISIALNLADDKMSGISISHKKGRVVYFPFPQTLQQIKPLLENINIKKIGYDLKSIYEALKKTEITLGGIQYDIMLAEYVLNPGEKISLSKLVLAELGEEFNFEKKKGQLSLVSDETSSSELELSASKTADYAFKLKTILEDKIKRISKQQEDAKLTEGTLEKLFIDIEMPLVKILADMELAGIKIDTNIFKNISTKIEQQIGKLESDIYSCAGRNFNINSPHQLAEVLYVHLKLDTSEIKKLKTGFSTAAEELKKLHDMHKIIPLIEQYRELFKLKTTYIDTLPKLIDENSCLHTSFNQAVTATGRLSSAEPNLQNIPIKNDESQLLRSAFVATPGYKLISADYSQIDLRAVAHVSGDKKLIEAFHRGDDIHKLTAAEINKVTLSKVTEKMRRSAKALNFGIIYGMGTFGFSQSAGIERNEAKKFIDTYMDKFSDVAKYMKDTREFARKNGYVETLLGRRRNIPEINSPNFQIAGAAERMAINMPIQGLAADIMKLAMIAVYKEFENKEDVRMLLQIHDEIILEVKSEEAEDVAKKIKEIMENVYKLRVPLVVDVKIGNNWGEI